MGRGNDLGCAYAAALIALPTTWGIDVGFMVVTPARVLLVLAIVATLAEVAPARHQTEVDPGRWLMIAWVVFLSLAAATTLESGSPRDRALGSKILEGAGVFWVAWWACRRSPILLQSVLVATTALMAALTTGMAIIGLEYQAVLFGSDSLGDIRFGLVRQEASFDAPLFYAVWLAAAGALALGLLFTQRGRRRWLAALAWAVTAVAMVTTASRFGFIAVLGVLGVVLMAMRTFGSGSPLRQQLSSLQSSSQGQAAGSTIRRSHRSRSRRLFRQRQPSRNRQGRPLGSDPANATPKPT